MQKKVFFSLFLALFITACAGGDGFEPINNKYTYNNSPKTTGHSKEVFSANTGRKFQADYTPSGDIDIFDKLKKEKSATTNKEFAQEIKSVEITRNQYPEQNHLVTFETKILLQKIDKPILFKTIFAESNLTKNITVKSSNTPPDGFTYQLTSRCNEIECLRKIMTLKRLTSTGKILAEASFIHSKIKTKVLVQLSNKNPTNYEPPALHSLRQAEEATKETVVVLEGASYSKLRIENPNDSKNPILDIKTDLITTDQAPVSVSDVALGGIQNGNASAVLAGNDPGSGSLSIDLNFKVSPDQHTNPTKQAGATDTKTSNTKTTDTETSNTRTTGTSENETFSARIYFPVITKDTAMNKIERELLDLPEVADNPLYYHEKPVIPITSKEANAPITLEVTEKLEKYRYDETVLNYIQQWQGEKRIASCTNRRVGRSRMQNFINNMTPLGPYITKALNQIDAPPQIAYVSIIETNYANTGNELFNTKVVNPSKYEDSGVFQITRGTGEYLVNINGDTLTEKFSHNFQVNELINGELQDSDSRGYLISSALLAGSYAKTLYNNYFHSDPALIFLAYNRGAGSIDKKNEAYKEILSRHSNFPITLSLVKKFNMAPCEGIDYAYHVLAAMFIGSNPKMYGFEINPNKEANIDQLPDIFPEDFKKDF